MNDHGYWYGDTYLRAENARLRDELAELKELAAPALREKSVSDALLAGAHSPSPSSTRVVTEHLLANGWTWTG